MRSGKNKKSNTEKEGEYTKKSRNPADIPGPGTLRCSLAPQEPWPAASDLIHFKWRGLPRNPNLKDTRHAANQCYAKEVRTPKDKL